MDDFPIVDPHHHLWDLERFSYPWLSARPLPSSVAGDVAPIAKSYQLDDYLADTANQNVVKSVHVDAGFDPSQPAEEARWLQSIADQRGFPHGVVARAELHRPDVESTLAAHCRFPNVRGIRHIVNWHPDPANTYVTKPDFLSDSAWLRGFARLKRYDLSFDLHLYPPQMADAAALAAAHGDTSIILNHAGMPVDRDADALSLWRAGMRALAAQPNVWVKISGLGMVDWRWTEDSIRPFVLEIIEIFEPDRCMFASNFPVDKLYSSFDVLYDTFKKIVSDFSIDEQRKLFSDTALAVYRI